MLNKKSIKYFGLIVACFIFSVFSYSLFLRYSPKSLVEVREIKGIKTHKSKLIDLVHPISANKISTDTTSKASVITLIDTQKPFEIQSFYETVLNNKGWKQTKQQKENGFIAARYKKNDIDLMVLTTQQEQETLITIEISK